MIDTVKIGLDRFEVSPGAELIINAGNLDYSTGAIKQTHLFTDLKGREIHGAYAHYNSDNLNLTIKPIGGHINAFVTFSAPKRLSDDNYNPITEKQMEFAFESVQDELNIHGIKTNIQDAKFSRIDTFKNILTNEETVSYARLFGLLSANRTKDRATHGATTWSFRNNSTEYCIYDKIEEMRNTGHLTEDMPKTLRFEHRCKKASKVKSFYKNVVRVSDLKNYGWDALIERNKKAWVDNFFKYDLDQIDYLVESEVRRELEIFKSKYGKYFFSKYLKAYGAYYLASVGAGIEIIKSALENMDYGRKKIYRAERELKEAVLLVESVKQDHNSNKTIGELYAELKTKMIMA